MIRNCQQFEQRLHTLLDQRIDPETDEVLCTHAADCQPCDESLMAYSLLHTEYLSDSDSMKIKLSNLNCYTELDHTTSQPPGLGRHLTLIASLAAMVVIFAAIWNGDQVNIERPSPIPQNRSAVAQKIEIPAEPSQGFSLAGFSREISFEQISEYRVGIPGLWQFNTLGDCLDWIRRAVLSPEEPQLPGYGIWSYPDRDIQYLNHLVLAAAL